VKKTDENVAKHPAFGYVKLNRCSTTGQRLFGSDLKHHHYVTLEIGHAELHRSLHSERHHPRGEIIEIGLSEMQLGQLLTSFAVGEGIQCTLMRVNGEMIPEPPRNPWMDKFDAEVQADFDEIRDQITVLKNKLQAAVDSSKPMGQKEKQSLLDMVKMMEQHIGSNVPFVMKQFKEKMEDVVAQARTEITAFAQRRMAELPPAAREDAPALELGPATEDKKS
jgi:hypothetical protein